MIKSIPYEVKGKVATIEENNAVNYIQGVHSRVKLDF